MGERAKNIIFGAFAADAASTGIHWNYIISDNLAVVNGQPKSPPGKDFATIIAENAAYCQALPPLDLQTLKPEFLDPPQTGWYSTPLGSLSPWGHEMFAELQALAKHGADAGKDDFFDNIATSTIEYFKKQIEIADTQVYVHNILMISTTL